MNQPIDASLWGQIKSFTRVFWVANTMEMLERLAYYGLRTVLPIYMVLSLEEGGPQFDHVQKGMIYAWWAAVQSGVPVFTGGYADRYGYKLTVGISIAVKIAGYLLMAYAVELAASLTNGVSATVPGHDTTFWVFTGGALLLALGTAIFKPGLQGIIGTQLNPTNGSVGWSVFYQLVNVGGFLGPFLAGYMRLLAWKWVFISCAVIVSLNYVFLLVFPEPDKPDVEQTTGLMGALKVLWQSAIGICEPRLMGFLVIFSGFWAMFHQLFDLLPNYIDDWVDSTMVADAIARPLLGELPPEWGGMLPQEYMINLNAGMCMLLAFVIGYLTGKVRSMTAMISGIVVAAAAIYSLGHTTNGWLIMLAIAMFSLGELMSSPTKMRYFNNIAPPGKKGLYLGYINATGGIGWALGSVIAGSMYEEGGDKVVLARRYLVDELGQTAQVITDMDKTAVLPRLMELTKLDAAGVRELLYTTYEPGFVWTHFALIGLVSMFGLILYDRITQARASWEAPVLVVMTTLISGWTYSGGDVQRGVTVGGIFGGLMLLYIVLERTKPEWLPQGQGDEDEAIAGH
ncbi:MAG: MFS transporter [Alphaproteobacteria bacterium]|nr:MFS transporter [Alphaproteobacteria bacterium]